MSGGSWIPVTQAITSWFPKDQPFSKSDALLSATIDYHRERSVTLRGYAKLWGWTPGKVSRFLTEIGMQINYTSGKTCNKRGTIAVTTAAQWRDNSSTIMAIDYKYLSANVTQSQCNDSTTATQPRHTGDTYLYRETETESEKDKKTTTTTTFPPHEEPRDGIVPLKAITQFQQAWIAQFEKIYGNVCRTSFDSYVGDEIASLIQKYSLSILVKYLPDYITVRREKSKHTPYQFAKWLRKTAQYCALK